MVFNHLKHPVCSMTRIATGSFRKLQNRPSAALKLQGNQIAYAFFLVNKLHMHLVVNNEEIWLIFFCSSSFFFR